MYWAYCFWLNSTWFDFTLYFLRTSTEIICEMIVHTHTTSTYAQPSIQIKRFLINDCCLRRTKSIVKRIWSHFRFSINFFDRSIDRIFFSMDWNGSPTCGTTQFEYYHIRLHLVTRIFLHDFLLLIKWYFRDLCSLYSNFNWFQFEKFRKNYCASNMAALWIECTVYTVHDK